MVRLFRIAAWTEAITWLGLLISMLFRYVLADNHRALWVFGNIHGWAFTFYVLVVFLVRAEYRWENRLTILALAASVPPFATVVFERWAFKQRFGQGPPLHEPPTLHEADGTSSL
jgi:integral membrane protein